MTIYAYVSAQSIYTTIAGPTGFDPVACYTGPLPEGEWIECPNDILPGDSFDGANWTRAPRPKVPISVLTFLRRFPQAKRIAIRASHDPIIDDFLALLDSTRKSEVELDDPDTIAGVGYLVSQGLLTEEEAAEVLA